MSVIGVPAPTETQTLQELKRDPSLSDRVAKALINYIFEQGLRPGEKLPSERELGDFFKVSRTVIREAVRALVGKGLLQSHSGARLTVSTTASDAVGDLLDLVLRAHAIGDPKATQRALWKLHEVRSTIEVEIAGLAAERATPPDIAQLRYAAALLESATADEDRVGADEIFHRAIAEATHNEFYVIVLSSLSGPLQQLRRATLKLKKGAPNARAAHARILKRIAAGDASGARAAMSAHIAESGRALGKLTDKHLHGEGP
jgi:GntR family transcriptional regulator, transcriptional repressor for pyruvate dehydrogenase complex